MRRRAQAVVAARALVATLALAACAKEREPPPAAAAMSAEEEERAGRLCQGYTERVCACAEHDATLRDTCDLAKGQPAAVRMHLEVLHGAPLASFDTDGKAAAPRKRSPLNEGERQLTEGSLRKIVAACVQLDAQLDPARCPRVSAPR
jgi:hypothetical protein